MEWAGVASFDLNHDRAESCITSLRVNLAARDHRPLTRTQRLPQPIGPRNPAGARSNEKKLIESRRMRPDDTTRLEVNEVDVTLPVAVGETLRASALALELRDRKRRFSGEGDHLHALSTLGGQNLRLFDGRRFGE